MQSLDERFAIVMDLFKQMGIQQHQAGMQGQQQAHDATMAQVQGNQDAALADQQHQQTLEQQDQAGQQRSLSSSWRRNRLNLKPQCGLTTIPISSTCHREITLSPSSCRLNISKLLSTSYVPAEFFMPRLYP
jgi:hypothetical protein